MTTENPPALTLRDEDAYEWNKQKLFAETIANTEFVPAGYRNKVPAILACIAYGRELGIGPMESLQVIDVIDGKASQSAELMVSQVRAAGHSMVPTELTDQVCTVKGKRLDSGDEMSFTYSIEMAKRAGLANKNNWKNYPEAMLWARAASQLCRMLFADVISGVSYTPEELDAPEVVNLPTYDILEGNPAIDAYLTKLREEAVDDPDQLNAEVIVDMHLDAMPDDRAVKEHQIEWIRELFRLMDEAGVPKWGESGLRAAVKGILGTDIPAQATTGLSGLRKEDLVTLKGNAWNAAEIALHAEDFEDEPEKGPDPKADADALAYDGDDPARREDV